MSLTNFVKKQQRVKEKLYPPALKSFMETQNRLKKIFVNKPFIDIRAIIDSQLINPPTTDSYINVFKEVEKITKHFEIGESVGSKLNFTYIKYDFLKLIDEITEDESEEIEVVIVEQTKSIKRIITDIYKDNSKLLKIEPRQFEEMIAELLYSKGFKVELTKQTKDNGFDIIALQMLEKDFPLKFLVECKKFKKNKVGIDIVRSFKEVVQTENANKGIIVTTSYFTRDANRKRLETPYLLNYKDKDDVLLWVTEYCKK